MDRKMILIAATALCMFGNAHAIVFKPPAGPVAARPAPVRHAAPARHGFWPRHGVFTSTFRHVPLSDPNDPFHETYKKNLGESSSKKSSSSESKSSDLDRRIAELERQLSALEAKIAKDEKAQPRKSPISVYSNITAPSAKTASGDNITISDSYVTIYTR